MKTKQLLMSAALGATAIFGLNSCGDKKETGANSDASKVLVITAIPDEKISDQELKFQALADYLGDKLDAEVKFSISKDYDAAVTRFANNEVQLVWFGGLSGVQARAQVEGAQAIAQGKADPLYKSYFIANSSTGLERSEDFPQGIKDMTFTFGSPTSTSGRLMPAWFIQQETGKTPEEFFTKGVQFRKSGGHVATAEAVHSGSIQVGAINYKTYDSLVKDKKIDPEVAKIIWVTPTYADYNFTAHPSLNKTFGDGFIEKLQTALVACDDKNALDAINRESIIKAKNADFEGIVKVAQKLGFVK